MRIVQLQANIISNLSRTARTRHRKRNKRTQYISTISELQQQELDQIITETKTSLSDIAETLVSIQLENLSVHDESKL